MTLTTLIATGFNGKLHALGVAPIEAYEALDERILSGQQQGHPQLTPLYEGSLNFKPIEVLPDLARGESISDAVQKVYSELVRSREYIPGPFGDFLRVIKIKEDGTDDDATNGKYFVTEIAPKAFLKPGLAADLGVVLFGKKEGNDVAYLVTGVRKAEPGKGKPAWLGGFTRISQDEHGVYQLDSGLYTILKEGKEEAGLKIACRSIGSLRADYDADEIDARVRLGETEFDAKIYCLGTIKTSDLPLSQGGETLANGQKRVYATTGYVCVVDLGNRNIDEKILAEWLTAGDDIGKLIFTDITKAVKSGVVGDLKDRLRFGIAHHNDFVKLVVEKAHEVFYGADRDGRKS